MWRKRVVQEILDDDDEVYVAMNLLHPEQNKRKHGGSKPGKAANLKRSFVVAHTLLVEQYFAQTPTYNEFMFERRFRMPKSLFMHIHDALISNYYYFQQRKDATGKLGISSLVKITAAIRALAYGKAVDELDEFCRIGESTAFQILDMFCSSVINLFGPEYMRFPTESDIKSLMEANAARGFPGMIGSIDCMKWEWALCPRALAGQYKGREKKPTVVLEAIASEDLWIWHAFFGVAGSNNDINVLQRSPFIHRLLCGEVPLVSYVLNGHERTMPYLLADGIYPNWPIFAKGISTPVTVKEQYYTSMQSALRKDVERAFGVIQKQWRILSLPARFWTIERLNNVVQCCLILHNMIVKSRRECTNQSRDENDYFAASSVAFVRPATIDGVIENWARVGDESMHTALRNDLLEHVWNQKGNSFE